MIWTYIIIAVLLVVAELVFFKVADHFNIIDKPNERSSHKSIVLRGGGIIFTIGLWIWSIWQFVQMAQGVQEVQFYPWLLAGVTLAAGISFVDDIHSLPDSVRLVVQFTAMFLVFYEIGLLHWDMWWIVLIALIAAVGGTNIFNFMDGINGITGGYSLAVLIPLAIENEMLKSEKGVGFVDESLLIVVGLAVLVFCFFNFRTKAKCFAGDVGSISIALILLFFIGRLIMMTTDVTWIILLLVYGVDGSLTICHRVMLHENLGRAHRKHAYQLMANELKMKHVLVSSIYMVMQLAISLIAIYIIPDNFVCHWIYFICVIIVLVIAYIVFIRKYYHLHEEYLASLEARK